MAVSVVDADILEEPRDSHPQHMLLCASEKINWDNVQCYRIARPTLKLSASMLKITATLDTFMHYLHVHHGKDVCDEFYCEFLVCLL